MAPPRQRGVTSAPFLIVRANFYPDLADMLEAGATNVLADAGREWERLDVPGAFEIPGAIAIAALHGKFVAYIALGCVIRGETSHYDHICTESARGLMSLSVNHRLAIGNGILTCETRNQALERADPERGNKGADAARAALIMDELRGAFLSA